MATRRMLSLKIIDTDAFLEMPASSQLLYFHLTMRADDEGFVDSPKRIMRLIGVGDDDLKILIAKRFILTFESGIVVIKHWLIHNTIRMDRFNKTNYQDEKDLLIIKKNSAYTETGNQMATNDGHKLSKVKISKAKLSKVKLELTPSQFAKKFFEDRLMQEEVAKKIAEKYKSDLNKLLIEINKFSLYWTEPNKSGTKVRWQLQQTFDVKRRIVTWLNKSNEFNINKGTTSL